MMLMLCAQGDLTANHLPTLLFMNEEREQFSRRLKEAIRQSGYPVRPGVLHKLFNSRYPGQSVSSQTVSRWLGGKTLPEQDKLQVLATLLGVSPHYLRFGDTSRGMVLGEGRPSWAGDLNALQWQVMQSYLTLPGTQQSLVGDLVNELAGLNHRLSDAKDDTSLPV